MKILDRYILTTFLKTFFSVFTILIFIFILQSVWLFVKELAGKDLDLIIIFKFLVYLLPTLVPLILPLTILLTSIMIFGNFAENYEFAAMKSSGISLQRAMRGISVFILLLSIITFFFANNVIPWGEYESRNLRRNIAQLTPAMAIAEGQFNTIGDVTIKVDEKSGENGNHLKNVVLFKKEGNKNNTVIKAKTGVLISSEQSNILQLVLFNGNYYHDINSRDPKKRRKTPHAKSSFEKYTMNLDLSDLNKVDLEEKGKGVSYRMLKINELIPTIDSLEQKITTENNKEIDNLYFGLGLQKRVKKSAIINKNIEGKLELSDKLVAKRKKVSKKENKKKDTSFYKGDVLNLFTNKEKTNIIKYAISSSATAYKQIENREKNQLLKISNLNQHKMALQKKFALAVSCFLLFFVGAPLGAIIRKGGMGLPMVIAIILFLSYWFIGMFAENSAEKGAISTFLGAWLSTIIMLPLGIMLTKNATSDKGIVSTDGITLFFSKIWSKITKEKKEQ
ncbi:MAG: LptF/LptG family permease [Flavobacteriaceae bacterium]